MKVLIALDDSPISMRAAREAARLFPNAEYLVVNVNSRSVPWVMTGDFGVVYPAPLLDLPAYGLDEDQLATRAEQAGLDDAEVMALLGDRASAICDAAEIHDVDVIVVGSHDKGLLHRVVNPSIAHAVVQGTYRPVLVVSGTPPTT